MTETKMEMQVELLKGLRSLYNARCKAEPEVRDGEYSDYIRDFIGQAIENVDRQYESDDAKKVSTSADDKDALSEFIHMRKNTELCFNRSIFPYFERGSFATYADIKTKLPNKADRFDNLQKLNLEEAQHSLGLTLQIALNMADNLLPIDDSKSLLSPSFNQFAANSRMPLLEEPRVYQFVNDWKAPRQSIGEVYFDVASIALRIGKMYDSIEKNVTYTNHIERLKYVTKYPRSMFKMSAGAQADESSIELLEALKDAEKLAFKHHFSYMDKYQAAISMVAAPDSVPETMQAMSENRKSDFDKIVYYFETSLKGVNTVICEIDPSLRFSVVETSPKEKPKPAKNVLKFDKNFRGPGQ